MGSLTVTADRIVRQAANTIPGNATGAEAACQSLTPSQVRDFLGMATTSDVTFDIVRATTSVLTPLVSNTASQLTLTGGPDAGYYSFPSVLLKTTTSATEYVRSYSGGGTQVLALHANGQSPSILMLNSTGDLSLANQVTNGDISLTTYGSGGYVNINNATNNGVLRVRQVEDTNTALILGNSTYGVTVPGKIVSQNSFGLLFDASSATNGFSYGRITNTSGSFYYGVEGSSGGSLFLGGSAYAAQLGTITATSLQLATNNNVRITIDPAGAATFSGVLTPSGGVTFPVSTWLTSSDTTERLYFVNNSWTTYKSAGSASYTHIFQDGAGTNRVLFGNVDGVLSYQYGFTAQDVSGTKDTRLQHDGTKGILSTSSGNLNLVPAGGTVAVTGRISLSNSSTTLPSIFHSTDTGWGYGYYSTNLLLFANSVIATAVTTSQFRLTKDHTLGWSSASDNLSASDVGLIRESAGVLQVNNGTLVSGGGSYGSLKCAGITASGVFSLTANYQDLADGVNIVCGTTTGTKLATGATQKLSFWGVTPVVQPASANQAALSLDSDVTGGDTVDKAAVDANFAAIQTLVNQLRSDLVAAGIIKGAA